ncbi:MAG: hypothetical protein ABW199_03425 [Caulobacterales bacterium]
MRSFSLAAIAAFLMTSCAASDPTEKWCRTGGGPDGVSFVSVRTENDAAPRVDAWIRLRLDTQNSPIRAEPTQVIISYEAAAGGLPPFAEKLEVKKIELLMMPNESEIAKVDAPIVFLVQADHRLFGPYRAGRDTFAAMLRTHDTIEGTPQSAPVPDVIVSQSSINDLAGAIENAEDARLILQSGGRDIASLPIRKENLARARASISTFADRSAQAQARNAECPAN